MAAAYYSAFTVQSGQVPATMTDFPVGILEAGLARLKTVGNGGHVQNANGYDIRPYSDAGLTSALTFQLVYFNATTGALEMYVNLASLDDGAVIYLGYGDAGISTDGSSTSTWNANFKAVYHFGDGATLSLADSTSNARTLTNNNTVTATAAHVVGGSAGFASASSQWLGNTAGGAPIADTPGTISCLVYNTDFAANQKCVSIGSTAANSVQFDVGPRTTAIIRASHNNAQANSAGTYSTATWVHAGARFASDTDRSVYLNGTGTQSTTSATDVTPAQLAIGAQKTSDAAALFMNGRLDEVRISDVDRGANWMTTEYNNLVAPSTFYAVGTEVAVGASFTPPEDFWTQPPLGDEDRIVTVWQ